MEGVDPDTLLEWLQTGVGDERDIQMMALEQLCMLLLMSDNIDRCFESCPPRTFLPALCKIFLDETATENVLEVTARAITYYLDVSNECTRRITQVDGAVKAICNRLAVAEMTDRTSKDLAEQCVKLLEHVCQRETSAVYDAGGLQCMLAMVRQHGQYVHKDTMHSAMSVVTRLCSKMEPSDASMPECSASLGALLEHDDPKVSECALRCFAALTDRFIRKSMDPVEMARHGSLVEHLLNSLAPSNHQIVQVSSTASLGANVTSGHIPNVGSSASLLSGDSTSSAPASGGTQKPASFTSIVISLLSNLCRGSAAVTEQFVSSPLLVPALKAVLTSRDERCVMDTLRLCDLLIVLLCEGRHALPRSSACSSTSGRAESAPSGFDRSHRHLIDAIRQRDTDALIDAVESGQVDANFTDDVGQTLLNWSSAFGTVDMVTYLCDKGADVNKGQRSSSLHYAACFGRPDVVKILLKHGANPDLRDEEGKTALDKARERSEEGHQQVATILESPSSYMQKDEPETLEKFKSDEQKQMPVESLDPEVVRELLEQLLPVFCDVFQRSMGTSVRRSSVSLIRKTIHHMSAESLKSLVASDWQTDDIPMVELGKSSGQKLAESIVNVIVVVLEHEEEVESHENVLQLMKSLFTKDVDFWVEQLIRVGVFEKVEAIASQPPAATKGGMVTTMVVDESGHVSSTSSVTVLESALVKAGDRVHGEVEDSNAHKADAVQEGKLDSTGGSVTLSRSSSSTPSVNPSLQALMTSETDQSAEEKRESCDEKDRNMMLNVPIHVDGESEASQPLSTDTETDTPPPTLEAVESQQAVARTTNADVLATLNKMSSAGVPRSRANAPLPSAGELATAVEDIWEIVQGKSYRWKDWRLIKSVDSLFIWCDAVALEFSDGSNGWFRFMLDGQLSTMYSSGSPESGADSAETRGEFLDKLTKARNAVPTGSPLNAIFTLPSANRYIEVGNWVLTSPRVGELAVANRDGHQQRMVIMEDFPGFVFESNRQTKHCFQAESTLGLDFVTGWAARGGGRRLRFRAEAQKAKLQELAKELWENYLKEARSKPRDALIELQRASALVKQICKSSTAGSIGSRSMKDQLIASLKCIHESVVNERLLSTFELSISGLVGALLLLLDVVKENVDCEIAASFRKIFSDSRSVSALVRKMVLVLETVEKFPQYLYDIPGGSSFGLQLLSRRIKLKLEHSSHANSGNQLLDRSGRTMKSEPLATVGQLKNYILRMVAKQWYDRERETYNFIKVIEEAKKSGQKLTFVYSSDFDDQGLIYWLGTNAKTTNDWTNPASVQVVHVMSSDGSRQPYGRPEDIFSRDVNALNCHTSDDKNAHFTMDLGVYIYPTMYTLRHARGYGRSALRSWLLQGSRNGRSWDVLLAHENDTSLVDPGSTATWPIACPEGKGPYRYLRIAQNGKNASNQTYYLSLSGFEIYGTVVDCVVEDFKPFEEKQISTPGKGKSKKGSIKENTGKEGTAQSTCDSDNSHANEPTFALLPGGRANNKVTSGVVVADSMFPSASLKNRIFRYRRGARLLAANVAARNNAAGSPNDGAPTCSIGSRVTRGPDWKWDQQGGGTDGTVISPVEFGWVDVQWDNNTSNSYRFGAEGKYDLEVKSAEPVAAGNIPVMRRAIRGLSQISREGNQLPGAPPPPPPGIPFAMFSGFSPFHVRQLPPAPRSSFEQSGSSQKSKTGVPFSRFHQNAGSHAAKPAVVETAGPSRETKACAAGPSAPSTISQKSMSTTNLFDGTEKDKRSSVASTNQAASAESLQHQTPSLENLLARSRIFDERIPEVITDDAHPTSPEPRARGFPHTGGLEEERVSANNNPELGNSIGSFGSEISVVMAPQKNAVSVAASTLTGGSQPLLRGTVDGEFLEVVSALGSLEKRDTRSSPRESIGVPNEAGNVKTTSTADEKGVSVDEANARNLASLSVSAPDLVLLRQRQQSAALSTEVDDAVINTAENQNELSTEETQRLASDGSSRVDTSNAEETNDARDALLENQRSLSAAVDEVFHESSEETSGTATVEGNVESANLAPSANSGEYNDLLAAYSEMLDSGGERNSEESQAHAEKMLMSQLMRNAFGLSEDASNGADSSGTGAQNEPASTEGNEGASSGSSAPSSVRRGVQSATGVIRSRLGGYADVLRTMMQQVIDAGGSLNALELEEIDDDIYDDDMQDDGNEEDCDDDYASGLSVEALAQAAAALRRQSSSGSTGSHGEMKLNWKQVVMGEAGRLLNERMPRSSGSTDQKSPCRGGLNRSWDDEFVLKRQFAALIPAFDPRPGRTNVNQTQDVELPQIKSETRKVGPDSRCSSEQPNSNEESPPFKEPKLRLFIRGPNLANIDNVTVELSDDDTSVFYFLQQLVQNVDWGQKTERTRRIWEPTYTLIYEDSSCDSQIQTINSSLAELSKPPDAVNEALAVLSNLYALGELMEDLEVTADVFISEKLTQKLMQELSDPLVVAAKALPSWCDVLVLQYPCLFSVETRTHYLRATAFGTSRAIVWLQSRRDQILEQTRGATSAAAVSNLAGARRDDHYPEFRVGRIKHERIKVPRNDEQLFEYAARVMKFHASRKTVLEVEYIGEEGTGLGPTLEFYALVAAEFQRKSLAMWICDDADEDQIKREETGLDLGEGVKPPGYYVRRAGGLFPAALPRHSSESRRASELFRILGIFLAKVLQDGRLVDLPLARPFLKLLVSSKIVDKDAVELRDVLSLDDFEEVSPMKGRILKELSAFARRKRAIAADPSLDPEAKRRRVESLTLCINGTECRVEDLSLSFSVNPPSSVFTYGEMELVEGGSAMDVTSENVDLYVEKCTDFYLNTGICDQITAFREGFDMVFPLRSLRVFAPDEVQTLLSGEQCPEWTREDVINYTEPKLGYTKDSPGFLRFVDVLVGMNAAERKSFLQFTTGCSSLPPGGLANLHPRLTVVRKVDSGDGSYPSVNTCVHYLKLPDYSSTEIMRERLLTATNEKGFHLN